MTRRSHANATKRAPRVAAIALALSIGACATLAGEGRGDVDLPTALAGPFRALKHGKFCETRDEGEVCTGVDELPPGTANGTVLAPPARSPSVLVRGELHVVLYASRGPTGKPDDTIVRLEARDGRSFDDVANVLVADAPFEGGHVTDPSALEVGDEIWLYYTIRSNGVPGQVPGIARARSVDGREGRKFVKDPQPVFTSAGAKGAWETDPPRAATVVRLPDGTFRMLYASGKAIGEAESKDGVTFTRLDGDPKTPEIDPVIVPSPYVDPATLPEGVRPPFDDDSVDDPSAQRLITPLGRVLWAVHYTGRDRRKGSSVGYAARFGDAGPFERREGFVFGGKLFGDPDGNSHANAPAVARFGDFALIYANIDQDNGQKIGVGIAPQKKQLSIE